MDEHDLAPDAGEQNQHFTTPAPSSLFSAPPARRSQRIKDAIQSANASSGAAKRKRTPSADAVSRPAAKTTKINSKSGKSHKSDDLQNVASPVSMEIAPVNNEEQPFRLFDLPDELWVKIGKMAIEDLPIVKVFLFEHFNEPSTLCSKLKVPAILQTCSALRKELRLHYYGSKKLQAVLHEDYPFEALRPYLQAIGPDARRLLDGFSIMGEADWDMDDVLDPPHDLSASWGVELVQTLLSRDRCEGCEVDHVEWKITFQ